MSCKICGRGDCTESFHSIKEQEQFEKGQEAESQTEPENENGQE